MKRFITIFGAALVMAACDVSSTANGPRAGGEDFPNTVQALGRILAMGADSTQDWNALESASTDVGNGGSSLGDSATSFAMRLSGVCQADSAWAIDGTWAYFAKTTCIPGTLLGSVHDSLVFRYFVDMKPADIDTVSWWSTDSVRAGYRSYTWVLPYQRPYGSLKRDADKFQFNVRREAGRWTDLTEMVADGGRDLAIGTGADNTYWQATRSLVKNAGTNPDTSWAMWIQPAAAGLPVIGLADSGMARVTKLTKLAVGRRIERGLIMAHRDTTRNYPHYWSATTDRTPWGYVRHQTAFGPRADSSFQARDTITLLDRFRSVSGDDSIRIEGRAILGPVLADRSKDSAVSLRYERYRSGAFERHSIWSFVSDKPVANGHDAESGKLFARVDFSDGRWIQFDGRWERGVFTGTFSTGNDSGSIVVDRDGSIRSTSAKQP